MKEIKTNVLRILEREKIEYSPVYYDLGGREFSGEAVAELTGLSPRRSFKTLTARGQKRGVLVFVIPVDGELDLKKAAVAAGDKRVEMLHQKELLQITGYERGEVSPVGMKKQFPTFIDTAANDFDTIAVSAGKKGCSVLLAPSALTALLSAEICDLVR